jgi:hypothetical protein
MKLILFSIIFIVTGCSCNYPFRIPFLDCGPNITELNVIPNLIQVDSATNIILKIKAWQFSNRENNPSFLDLEVKSFYTGNNVIILFEKSKIYIDGNKINKVEYFEGIQKINANSKTEGNFQIKNCCTSYPVTINLDSIPIITGLDTVYKSFKIEVSKFK